MKDDEIPAPVFLKWFYPDAGERHIFVRSDWIMDVLFEHLAHEDAVRVWTKMCAARIRTEEGEEAAQEFLDAFGVTEH